MESRAHMLAQSRLILVDRLYLQLPLVFWSEILLDLVEVLDSCPGPGGAVDVSAGVVGAAEADQTCLAETNKQSDSPRSSDSAHRAVLALLYGEG